MEPPHACEAGRERRRGITWACSKSRIACSRQMVRFSSDPLASVARCVLALPPYQQLWSPRPEAEAQHLRDDVLQSAVSPDHRDPEVAPLNRAQMDRAADVPA